MDEKKKYPLYQFEEIIATLRGEGGCPWDRKQTHESLRPYLLEETYEALDAIDSGNLEHLKEELGDILLQIFLHAQIAKEQGLFTIDDVAKGIAHKIVTRHPHVFGDAEVEGAEQVLERWEELKKKEKPERRSILDGIPKHLPALLKAYRVQQRASRVGFDWEGVDDAADKIIEEANELKKAIASGEHEAMTAEAGDVLFSVVNVLRHIHLNPEEALRKAVAKFIKRFAYVERRAAEMNISLESMNIEEMERLWQESKDRA